MSAMAVIVTRPVFCAPALSQCRELSFNQLTGTLPAAWSALAALNNMWVPCALLIRAHHLAVSAALHVRQASGRCSCAANCQPTQHHASGPAACVCRSAACSSHCSCQPCPLHSHARTAAQQLHPRALQLVLAAPARRHDCHIIILMAMLTIGG